MSVLSTTRRRPAGDGASARSWSASDSAPASGYTSVSGMTDRSSVCCTRLISPMPGRKTKMSPAFSRKARRVTSATASSSRCCLPGGAQVMSTGCCRPALEMIGAGSPSPKSFAKRSVSAVADIASTRRSVRKFLRASRHNARPTSVGRFRSCTSSKITSPIPGSSGSFCKRRVRIPSVTTSMRVLGPIRRSSRV